MKIRVGVIFGGESVEHEVSIISAVQAMNKMDNEKYEIIPIYISKDREWWTGDLLKDLDVYRDTDLISRYAKNVVLYFKNGEYVLQSKKGLFKRVVDTIDVAFPIVHGTNVEDGVLQGYLQSIGIPFVGSDVYASVVGQDKVYMKNIFEAEDLPITKYVWFYDTEWTLNSSKIIKKINKLSFPLIIKPATLGSSIGIAIANNEKELTDAIEDAITYDNKVLVEEVVQNLVEVNISVLGNYENASVSELEEVIPSKDLLTFNDKYIGSAKTKGIKNVGSTSKAKGMLSANRIIPATISDNLKEEISKIAIDASRALGTSGVARIDFLVDKKTKKVYINEINSIPGSLAFYLWEPLNKDLTELVDDLINLAIKDYKRRMGKTHVFKSNILSGYNSNLKGIKGIKGKLK